MEAYDPQRQQFQRRLTRHELLYEAEAHIWILMYEPHLQS
jgi:hypothetical protein